MKKIRVRYLTHAAVIAALYAALTLLCMATPLGALAFGPINFRISEALTVLPALTPAAIPGLAVGCLVSNLTGSLTGLGYGLWDVILGTGATLLAAWLSGKIKNPWLVPLPPVVLNGLIVGWMLHFTANLPFWGTVATVGLGEAAVCYLLGMPLLLFLRRNEGAKRLMRLE